MSEMTDMITANMNVYRLFKNGEVTVEKVADDKLRLYTDKKVSNRMKSELVSWAWFSVCGNDREIYSSYDVRKVSNRYGGFTYIFSARFREDG